MLIWQIIFDFGKLDADFRRKNPEHPVDAAQAPQEPHPVDSATERAAIEERARLAERDRLEA